METLRQLILDGEDWLVVRVLAYAKTHDYTRYTSTLLEAWRASIVGISESIGLALADGENPPELGPDEDFTQDPVAAFGIREGQLHRARGISMPMFLGLMKYYRQSYMDLVHEANLDVEREARYHLTLNRCFDRLEIGFCTAWSAVSQDGRITELQEANRRLTNEKNKYLTLFESLRSPVILLDAQGRLANLNHAAARTFLGWDIPGSHYYGDETTDLSLGWLTERLTSLIDTPERVTETGPETDVNLETRTCEVESERTPNATGRVELELDTLLGSRHYQVQSERMLDVSGKFEGTVVILHDVTAQHKATTALRASNRRLTETLKALQAAQARIVKQERLAAVGQLAAGMAHELNNIMTPVVLYSDWLCTLVDLPRGAVDQVTAIAAQARDAARLIRQLLDFTSSAALDHRLIDGTVLVSSLAASLAPELPPKIRLHIDVPDEPITIMADAERLGQALKNLTDNALDAMPAGGDLRIALACRDDQQPLVSIAVSDTGRGIEPHHLRHLFEPFFTTKAVGSGVGLSLAQTYGIVKQHGGDVLVDTEKGRGTTITITLPLTKQ